MSSTLYDALVDSLEDEPISRAEETLDPVEALDGEDDSDRAILDEEEYDRELDLGADDLLAGVEDNESWSDDPVRMYLTQLGDGYNYTLEEVGHIFKVTRERIRQIEAKSVRKLQQPSRNQELRDLIQGHNGGDYSP